MKNQEKAPVSLAEHLRQVILAEAKKKEVEPKKPWHNKIGRKLVGAGAGLGILGSVLPGKVGKAGKMLGAAGKASRALKTAGAATAGAGLAAGIGKRIAGVKNQK